ncbi:MAG: hypothetical protein JWO71_4809 [Candidatus Acidoferrum typicum]|nr:hypothetical protein [Candidatus Acidoferrum typicum]
MHAKYGKALRRRRNTEHCRDTTQKLCGAEARFVVLRISQGRRRIGIREILLSKKSKSPPSRKVREKDGAPCESVGSPFDKLRVNCGRRRHKIKATLRKQRGLFLLI